MCLHAEQLFHVAREREAGDSARIGSLGFVDDLQYKYGYDLQDRAWTKQEALDLLESSRTMYPPPLELE